MSDLSSFVTGLSNGLNAYLGNQIELQGQVNAKKDLMAFEQGLDGQINEDMAEQLVQGGGQLVTSFKQTNGRYPTYKEAKAYLDTLDAKQSQRRPYYTVLGYNNEAGGYVTHNAADNTFEVKPMSQLIGKTKPNLPDAEAEWFSKAQNVAEIMDDVNKLYKDSYVGPLGGRLGRATDVYTPFGNADRSKFRNLVAKGFNNLIYLRSGKQINQEEALRMAEEFMSQNNTPVAFKSAWDTMAKELNTLAQQRQENLEKMGFARAENLKGKGLTKTKELKSGGEWSIEEVK